MPNRKRIDPLAVVGDVVVVDATPLITAKPTAVTRPELKLLRRLEIRPVPAGPAKLLTRPQLLDLIGKTGKFPLGPKSAAGVDLRLSPRQPYVEGRGHVDFYGARVVSPDGDHASFQYDDPDLGFADVWFKGLQPGASYAAQIRLSALGEGHFRVRGSDTGTEILFGSGPQRTVVAVMQDLRYDMTLLRLDAVGCSEWIFYDVTLTTF